jgi:hypothetical protein
LEILSYRTPPLPPCAGLPSNMASMASANVGGTSRVDHIPQSQAAATDRAQRLHPVSGASVSVNGDRTDVWQRHVYFYCQVEHYGGGMQRRGRWISQALNPGRADRGGRSAIDRAAQQTTLQLSSWTSAKRDGFRADGGFNKIVLFLRRRILRREAGVPTVTRRLTGSPVPFSHPAFQVSSGSAPPHPPPAPTAAGACAPPWRAAA